jgi:hypothetical protein
VPLFVHVALVRAQEAIVEAATGRSQALEPVGAIVLSKLHALGAISQWKLQYYCLENQPYALDYLVQLQMIDGRLCDGRISTLEVIDLQQLVIEVASFERTESRLHLLWNARLRLKLVVPVFGNEVVDGVNKFLMRAGNTEVSDAGREVFDPMCHSVVLKGLLRCHDVVADIVIRLITIETLKA